MTLLPSLRRRWYLVLPLVLILMLILIGGLGLLRPPAPTAPPSPAQAGGGEAVPSPLELDPTDLTTARRETIAATLSLSGLLQPLRESTLTAEVEGRIDTVLVRPGEKVRQGQVLARMDPRDLSARLAEQEANLAAARAQLDLADKTQRRNEELQARHFISGNNLDSSRSNLDASREAMRAREAQLDLARQALDKTVIRAPMEGVIADRAVQPGQHVGLNTRLFSIVDLSELEFAANVPVSEIANLQPGQGVKVAAEGGAGEAEGKVERIAPTADPATRMIPVYIRVANPGTRLKGGMAVLGLARLREKQNVITLPREALREESPSANRPKSGGTDTTRQILVVSQGKVVSRTVTLGVSDGASGRVEIVRGVEAGETVILARVSGLQPGQTVRLPASAAGVSTPSPDQH